MTYNPQKTLRNRKHSGQKTHWKTQDYFRGYYVATTVISKRNRHLTAPDITAEINTSNGRNISASTARRRLVEVGLQGRVAAKKP